MNTVHRHAGSPTPDAASPSATSVEMNGHTDSLDNHNYKSRTIAIMNISDTVTPARVEKLVGQFGDLVKFTFRPDHAGAIVEYAEEKSVGKAEFGLAGYELEGHKIRTGSVYELKQQKPIMRTTKLADQLVEKKKEEKKNHDSAGTASSFGGLAPRQAQNARGTGRRGGLGFKRGLGFSAKPSTTNDEDEKPAGGKGNDYFKSLMASGKKDDKEKPVEGEKMEV